MPLGEMNDVACAEGLLSGIEIVAVVELLSGCLSTLL